MVWQSQVHTGKRILLAERGDRGHGILLLQAGLRVAHRAVLLVVFQAVEVLVPLAADVALEGLLLLHAQGAGIGCRGLRVHDGEGAVAVLVELLRVMSVLLMIPEG